MIQQFHFKRSECICLQKDMSKDIHMSFIHSSQNLETSQMSFNKRVDK